MYHEFGHGNNRDGWKFTYKGSELTEAAKTKVKLFDDMETKARTEYAALLTDRTKSASGGRAEALKKRIAFAGGELEKCRVWALEFERFGDREYQLSLGDVVYFGLVKNVTLAVENEEE